MWCNPHCSLALPGLTDKIPLHKVAQGFQKGNWSSLSHAREDPVTYVDSQILLI